MNTTKKNTQENNYLSNGTETKIIDYDYSQMNYRGCDVAAYIVEASLNYDPTLPNKYAYEHDKFGIFESHLKVPEYIDVDFVLATYLTRFYEKHADRILGDTFKQEYPTLQSYLDKEMPIFKLEIKKMILQ